VRFCDYANELLVLCVSEAEKYYGKDIYTVSQKSSTSYFAKYFRTGLTDCKNFNGYRVTENKRTHVCNQCFNF